MLLSAINRIAALMLFLIFLSSCSTTMVKTTSASDAASLKPEPMKIWSRPIETGFKVIGMAEGNATSTDMKKAVSAAPSFFLAGSVPKNDLSPVAKLAAYNIVKDKKADGIFVTMVLEEETPDGVKTAWVKGVLLKLVFYDTVSEERSDSARNCENGCPGSFIVTPNNKAKE